MNEKNAGLPDWIRKKLTDWASRRGAQEIASPTFQESANQFLKNIVAEHGPTLGQNVGKAGAEAFMGEAAKGVDPVISKIEAAVKEKAIPFMKSVQEQVEPTVRKAVNAGADQVADTAAKTVRNLSIATGVGGATGAAISPEDERVSGAFRGALGGLVGGAAGSAWGRLLPKPSVLPGLGGAILGGAAGGLTLRGGQDSDTFGDPGMVSPREIDKESSMQGFKYAGVTLDWYDDNGETLKQKFPTLDAVPSIIKEASIQPKEKVPNEDFALIMIDGGHVFRKFACADAGTTAMSVIYFMEHGDKLPMEAQKTAATNLVSACLAHNLLPPTPLTKKAELLITPPPPVVGKKKLRMLSSDEEAQKVSSVVNVTGKRPTPKTKVASSDRDEDYAVVMSDGSRYYPIHTWDLVKKAEDYLLENRVRFQPEIRRQFSVKLASKAKEMGYPLDSSIQSLGSQTYARDNEIEDAIDMRKVACAPTGGSREFLEGLFEKRSSIHPEVFAECLKRFDVAEGLDKGWDKVIPDPWSSTFGIKTASYDVIWEEGADRVTRDALEDLAENHLHLVTNQFTYDVAKEFKKDPVGIFESMPLTHKKIFARMASDVEADGSSEKGTNQDPFPSSKKSLGPVEGPSL